jgi:hypothetical protein
MNFWRSLGLAIGFVRKCYLTEVEMLTICWPFDPFWRNIVAQEDNLEPNLAGTIPEKSIDFPSGVLAM